MPDISIKDTYKAELDTFLGIFDPQDDHYADKLFLAHMGFSAGAHSTILLALKALVERDCRSMADVADILRELLDESEKHVPIIPHNQN